MSITVRVPTQLRTLTGGAGELSLEGSTVGGSPAGAAGVDWTVDASRARPRCRPSAGGC